jgi:hypothetical protein
LQRGHGGEGVAVAPGWSDAPQEQRSSPAGTFALHFVQVTKRAIAPHVGHVGCCAVWGPPQ